MMDSEKILQHIRMSAPMACELEDSYDLESAVQRLLEFAWQAVKGHDQKTTRDAFRSGYQGATEIADEWCKDELS